jgi:hypothetical protein
MHTSGLPSARLPLRTFPAFAGALALTFALPLTPSASAEVSIVLHAIDHPDRVHCLLPEEQGYRDAATQTRTSVPANAEIDVFVYLVGFERTSAVGFKLEWPADWEYFGWVGDCLPPAQITVTDLEDHSIDIGTAFNQRGGGAPLPLGYASFRTSGSGEVAVLAGDICAADGVACYIVDLEEIAIPLPRWGRVAVGGPGYNPAALTPVASATWGSIKATYRR